MLAPLVFASSVFIAVEFMPGWLQAFARNQPVSVTAEGVALDRRGDDPAGVADDLLVRGARGDLRADRSSPLPPGALGATETPRHLHRSPNPRC